ncbi:MAG: energy transducer TonB [Rhodothermales bacterium]|nr:energy transducer TonB [Rhodothermales bacterium]
MALRKTDKANIRQRYPLFVQVGLVLSLALLILAFKLDLRKEAEFEIVMPEQEVVQMEEIQQTKQIQKPPPPPRPPVPVEVPDDEILEDDELDLDASLDIDEVMDLPPPPPPAAEEEEEAEPEIFVIVEDMPELIGGLESVQKRINYPPIAKKAGVEGRVIVQFVVDEAGSVVDPVVVRGIGAGCDDEAIRAVSLAKFKPGKQRGKPVRVKMSLPITFKLK